MIAASHVPLPRPLDNSRSGPASKALRQWMHRRVANPCRRSSHRWGRTVARSLQFADACISSLAARSSLPIAALLPLKLQGQPFQLRTAPAVFPSVVGFLWRKRRDVEDKVEQTELAKLPPEYTELLGRVLSHRVLPVTMAPRGSFPCCFCPLRRRTRNGSE